MQIQIDEKTKDGVLVKNDGTEVSRYSYKNLIAKDYSFEEFKRDIDGFNKTLAMQPEFDDIKKMADYVKIHDFG